MGRRNAAGSTRWSRLSARKRRLAAVLTATVVVAGGVAGTQLTASAAGPTTTGAVAGADTGSGDTTTPIKHLVVIYGENVSFDHYFATYPYAANTDGTTFTPASNTAKDTDTELNAGLLPGSELSAHNPTAGNPTTSLGYTQPNPNQYQPQRLSDAQAVTCDQNHSYGPEQDAEDAGSMDNFVATTAAASCSSGNSGEYYSPGMSMDYYDGNTVTGLWNYAQNYAMSDNNWDAVFGPSTPGALDLVSGNTYSGNATLAGTSGGTVNSDLDPQGDSGDTGGGMAGPMQGANVGDLLNSKDVTWGWFEGGFDNPAAATANMGGVSESDYQPHHEPFQYYPSTANLTHQPAASGADVGYSLGSDDTADPANHQYDMADFDDIFTGTAINGSVPTLPAVSYLKAPSYEDGHAGYSDPLDEQEFLTTTIDEIEQSSYWPSTAIVISYDDSDGWYDHVAPQITNSSSLPSGGTGDSTICTDPYSQAVPELDQEPGRCGPSQRVPLLVISPYAKKNYVSHVLTTQVSILRFIEQNWQTGSIDSISSVPGSFDASTNGLDDLFDFAHPQPNEVLLDSQMYQPGFTPGSTIATNVANLNPTFGAVRSTPADVTAPIPAPVIRSTLHTIQIPEGTPAPTTSAFLTQIGASITNGTLSTDLSALGSGVTNLSQLDTTHAGVYDVELDGSDRGVPAPPLRIPVQVSPLITVATSTVRVPVGKPISATALRTLAGAAITDDGTLDVPDLSSVDFGTAGAYLVHLTGVANGASAIPTPVEVVVGNGGITGAAIRVAAPQVWYAVGPAPSAARFLDDAGVTTATGVKLDPVTLAAATFAKTGSYTIRLTGVDSVGMPVTPASVTVHVITRPRISIRRATVTTTVGTRLTSAQVLARAFATITSGSLSANLSAVSFAKPGRHRVTVTGADHGVPATSRTLTVLVTAIPTRTRLTASAKRLTARANGTARVRLTVTVSPKATGKVRLYDGKRILATLALKHGTATRTVSLTRGSHRLHAAYLGATRYKRSTSTSLTLAVRR